jgi:tellurite resistance protein TerA
MSKQKTSQDSLRDATRSRAKFSGHGGALGAAGKREVSFDPENCEYLRQPGQSIAVSAAEGGFEEIMIGVEWDNIRTRDGGFFSRLLGKATGKGVDLDLGCLYEMEDGTRGCIQAFGKKFGNLKKPPYMELSGDERTGDADGHDEYILVNGKQWSKIKRILVYIYLYTDKPGELMSWRTINPKIIVDVPGDEDLILTLGAHNDKLCLCAVGGLEQVRGGIRLTNHTEYFPGHAEMDRAFGFGLNWEDGFKE